MKMRVLVDADVENALNMRGVHVEVNQDGIVWLKIGDIVLVVEHESGSSCSSISVVLPESPRPRARR